MSSGPRLPFTPEALDIHYENDRHAKNIYASTKNNDSDNNTQWVPVAACTCTFSLPMFFKAIEDLIMYPERNSPFILRSEIIRHQKNDEKNNDNDNNSNSNSIDPDLSSELDSLLCCSRLSSFTVLDAYKRLLIPKRPHYGELEQSCFMAQFDAQQQGKPTTNQEGIAMLVPHFQVDDEDTNEQQDDQTTIATTATTATTTANSTTDSSTKLKIPFYHPKVSAIAFRYIPIHDTDPETSTSSPTAQLRIEYLTYPDFPLPLHADKLDTNSRVYRTALALLGSVFRYGTGFMTGYVKRVHHDLIVPKDIYQDMYLEMKERWTWVVSNWPEKTDPQKHVFEDIAIAAYIICLWKIMFDEGKPRGGFVDIGAGNGLLVHILAQEGYKGYGIDMRARKSWEFWRQQSEKSGVPTKLIETTLTPPELVQTPSSFVADTFFIGNHADEMTPWIPLLAAATERGTFINIPCCLHTLSGRFTSNTYQIAPDLLDSIPQSSKWLETFSSITSEGGGRYNAYQRYLFELTLKAAFIPEREALRIPSVSQDPDCILDNAFFDGHQSCFSSSSSKNHVLPKLKQFSEGIDGSIRSSSDTDANKRGLLSVKDIRLRVLTRPFIQTRNIAIIGRQRIYDKDDKDNQAVSRDWLHNIALENLSQFTPRPKLTTDH